MNYLKSAWSVVLCLAISACGGGGGSPGATSGGSGNSTPTLAMSIHDTSGTAVNNIVVGGGYTARATVKDSSGAPVSAKLVTFSLDGESIATLKPATALTNSAGIAEVAIAPVSISSIGAATLAGTATVAGTAATGQVDFSVQGPDLSLSAITLGSSSLPSGGITPVQVTALIGGQASTGVPVNVTFTVGCGRINGLSTSDGGVSVTTDGNGVASAVYEATDAVSLCSGAVTVSASAPGAAPKSTTVNVAAPSANAIAFVSATPSQIFIAGSGAVDQAIVKFKVLSSAGTPMSNVSVKFSIVTNPGGVGLGAAGSTGATTATTNAAGEALISVFSGTIPGAVKVRAELVSSPSVFAESQNLTVASGPPSQRFMSLSAETFNIEGWNRDGTNTQLTARIADRQGNAVEDGTVVNFTAEGGQVARSCATTRTNGISQCSVTFQSQNPRPAGGRVSILAYLEGTKDYTDINGNNRYDAGTDTLVHLGDAYRDDNENGSFESASGEFLIPRGGSLTCPSAGEPFPSRANTCDSGLATTVRQQAVILFSSSNPGMDVTELTNGVIKFRLFSLHNPLLPLPAGTTVTAVGLDNTASNSKSCSILDGPNASPIANINPTTNPSADLSTSHEVKLKDCDTNDVLTIRVTTPSGLLTSFPFVLP